MRVELVNVERYHSLPLWSRTKRLPRCCCCCCCWCGGGGAGGRSGLQSTIADTDDVDRQSCRLNAPACVCKLIGGSSESTVEVRGRWIVAVSGGLTATRPVDCVERVTDQSLVSNSAVGLRADRGVDIAAEQSQFSMAGTPTLILTLKLTPNPNPIPQP